MGLNSAIARASVRVVHVLIVEVPGWQEARLRAEGELVVRGWVRAKSPADADVLLVCGSAGAQLRSVCQRIWSQLPGPRAQATVYAPEQVASVLDDVVRQLLDVQHQRRDARSRTSAVGRSDAQTRAGDEHARHGAHGHHQHGHHEEHGHTQHSDEHESSGHAHGDMSGPGGIPLASGRVDRDGLEMDVLHIPFGPVLPHWPAGLVVRCVVHGDVIESATAEVLAAAAPPDEHDRREGPQAEARAAVLRRCEAALDLLALSASPHLAALARRVRDGVASGQQPSEIAESIDNLRTKVRRAWLLRWSLRGIPVDVSPADDPTSRPDPRSSALYRRLDTWLGEAHHIVTHPDVTNPDNDILGMPMDDPAAQRDLLVGLPDILAGTEIAAARLIVAGLGIDTAQIARLREQS